jgi:hypothetical protein
VGLRLPARKRGERGREGACRVGSVLKSGLKLRSPLNLSPKRETNESPQVKSCGSSSKWKKLQYRT